MLILSNRYERVILIDAAEIGRQPGEWVCLNTEQVSRTLNDKDNAGDGHRLNIRECTRPREYTERNAERDAHLRRATAVIGMDR